MIGLIFFTIILYYQLITTHITSRTKDIGIMKSLGVSEKDILSVFIVHAMILSLLSFVVQGLLTVLFLVGFNTLLSNGLSVNINIYTMNLSSIGLAIIVCIIIPLVSSILPLVRLTRKEPVDIIKLAQRN